MYFEDRVHAVRDKLSAELERQLLSTDIQTYVTTQSAPPGHVKVLLKTCETPPSDTLVEYLAGKYGAIYVPYVSDNSPYMVLIVPKVSVPDLTGEDCVLEAWHVPEIAPLEKCCSLALLPLVAQVTVNDAFHDVGLDRVHAAGYLGKGVPVFIIDSGIDLNNTSLMAHVKGHESFVDDTAQDILGHGTATAFILAKAAPEAHLYIIKIFRDGEGDISQAMSSMEVAAMKIGESGKTGVMNLSWGAQGYPPLDDLATRLSQKYPVIIVAAAGNDGPHPGTVTSPAQSPEVVSVGATSIAAPAPHQVADFSSRGPVDNSFVPFVCAPGGSSEEVILTVKPGGKPAAYKGTSFASPIVAGAMACLLPVYGDQTKNVLYTTARDLAEPGPDNACGYGLLDAGAALTGEPTQTPVPMPTFSVSHTLLLIAAAVGVFGVLSTASVVGRGRLWKG